MSTPPFGEARFLPINARDWVDRLALCTDGLFTSPRLTLPPIGIASLIDIKFPIPCPYLLESIIQVPFGSAVEVSLMFPISCPTLIEDLISHPFGTATINEIDFPIGLAETL